MSGSPGPPRIRAARPQHLSRRREWLLAGGGVAIIGAGAFLWPGDDPFGELLFGFGNGLGLARF